MSTYVLVHGAWHGAWVWEKVTPRLAEAGHRVIAVDLPGHGADPTPVGDVTMAAYVGRVREVLGNGEEPAILVGHSMGGGVITQAAEEQPEAVRTLVYVAGLIPRDGETMFDILSRDQDSLILQNQVLAEDNLSATIRAAAIPEIFYGDCSAEDIARATIRLVPQAIAPVVAPIHTTRERFGTIPRVFLETLHDRAIPPALQKEMYTAMPCDRVISLETSHSPFLSAPGVLAGHLASL